MLRSIWKSVIKKYCYDVTDYFISFKILFENVQCIEGILKADLKRFGHIVDKETFVWFEVLFYFYIDQNFFFFLNN